MSIVFFQHGKRNGINQSEGLHKTTQILVKVVNFFVYLLWLSLLEKYFIMDFYQLVQFD